MIRRTFLSTLSALCAMAVAPFGWLLRWAHSEPELTVIIADQLTPGGLSIRWTKGATYPTIHEKDTGRPLRLIEQSDDGWATFQNDYAGIRCRIDPESDHAIAWVDWLYWSERPWAGVPWYCKPREGSVVAWNVLCPRETTA